MRLLIHTPLNIVFQRLCFATSSTHLWHLLPFFPRLWWHQHGFYTATSYISDTRMCLTRLQLSHGYDPAACTRRREGAAASTSQTEWITSLSLSKAQNELSFLKKFSKKYPGQEVGWEESLRIHKSPSDVLSQKYYPKICTHLSRDLEFLFNFVENCQFTFEFGPFCDRTLSSCLVYLMTRPCRGFQEKNHLVSSSSDNNTNNSTNLHKYCKLFIVFQHIEKPKMNRLSCNFSYLKLVVKSLSKQKN